MTGVTKSVREAFTRETATAVDSFPEAKRYAAKAAKFSQESAAGEAFVGVVAAYATHAAIRTGYLGGSEGITADEYAALFGRSKSTVTLWKRLAVAFVDKGIDPESDLGRVLRAGGANKGTIAKVVMDSEKTEADVREAAAAVYQTASDGSITGKTRTVTREGATTPDAAVPEVPRNDDTRVSLMEACLAALSSGDLTPGIAKRLGEFHDSLGELLDSRKVAKTA